MYQENSGFQIGNFVCNPSNPDQFGYITSMNETHAQVYYPDLFGKVWVPFLDIQKIEEEISFSKLFDTL